MGKWFPSAFMTKIDKSRYDGIINLLPSPLLQHLWMRSERRILALENKTIKEVFLSNIPAEICANHIKKELTSHEGRNVFGSWKKTKNLGQLSDVPECWENNQ